MVKRAIILFNLGGPDSPAAIQPFLFNLFKDRAIINLPNPMRWLLAKIISKRRTPTARKIYSELGGKSPLLELTLDQGIALESQLNSQSKDEIKVFIAMRYWHPMSSETVITVKKFNPEEIILIPLYPQFSTATTGSSLQNWHQEAKKVGLTVPTKALCCYPTNINLVKAQTDLLIKKLNKIKHKTRVLFSAHGLPKKIIDRGDPYQNQIEKTARAISIEANLKDTDWAICYQSRVGPLEWIGPSLDKELVRAAKDDVGVIILPIAFVSEHSETLVELDIEYYKIAQDLKILSYDRIPAVGTHPMFIMGLAELVNKTIESDTNLVSEFGIRVCPIDKSCCPLKENNQST
jgi:ferrochelatase